MNLKALGALRNIFMVGGVMYGDSCPLKIYFHSNFLDSPHYHSNGQNIPIQYMVFKVLCNTKYVYGIV